MGLHLPFSQTLIALTAATASTTGSAYSITDGGGDAAGWCLATLTGGDGTTAVAIQLQTSPDNATWVNTGSTISLSTSTPTASIVNMTDFNLLRYVRIKVTITGTAPTGLACTAGVALAESCSIAVA